MELKKPSRMRDPRYLEWVREQRCLVTLCFDGTPPNDPHHVRTWGGFGGDDQVVPLCRKHHTCVHAIGPTSFERGNHLDLADEAKALRDRWLRLGRDDDRTGGTDLQDVG